MNPLFAELGAQRRFVVYELVPLSNGKTDKVPVDPATGYASTSQKPENWLDANMAAACALALGPQYGVGIALREPCGLFFIDLDGCIDAAGQLSELAQKFVSDFTGCYVEYSPSGKGLHIYGSYAGTPPPHSCRNTPLHIELYTRERFMTTTGRTYQHGSALYDATTELWGAAYHYFKPSGLDTDGTPPAWTTEDDPRCTITGTDDERINWLRTHKSFAAKLSPSKVTFDDLWTLNVDKLVAAWPQAHDSKSGLSYNASNADQSFFNYLAFGFANNCDAIQRVALEHPDCKLRREKWGRADYLRGTILKAIAIPKSYRAVRAAAAPRAVRAAAAPRAVPPVALPQQAPQRLAPPVGESGPIVPPPPAPPPPSDMPEAVPESFFSCTDQANAKRLQMTYGNELMTIADDFYAWDGQRWKLDEGLAHRFACNLSRLVLVERDSLSQDYKRMSAAAGEGVGDDLIRLETEIKSLTAWAVKCESVAAQNNALGLLRKLLNVPVERVDANPWLLNVLNGTVDLRDGTLLPHNSSHLITKLAPVAYEPNAQAPVFLRTMGEIFQGDLSLVEFLQRWYGYSATGDVREQKILIKWGPGGNGKSTLGDVIKTVLGEYTCPATFGLLTGKDNAGSTSQLAEIANLRGKRHVVASESEDGAKLREAQLKQLTGGDSLTGKRLYGQLFSFSPTHKLELLTNHKPVIKGSDFAIWRRIMLLNFPVKYGSLVEVESGEAMAVKDTTLPEKLLAERAGILAWIIRGTALWLAQGLSPPKAVLDASAEYRQSQDHVAEFVTECCTVEADAKTPTPALYATYKAWCHDAGRDHPVTRQRLVDELERRVPGFVRPDMAQRTAQGTFVMGLKLRGV